MAKPVTDKRIRNLLKVIRDKEGSYRYYWEVYEAAMARGLLVYREIGAHSLGPLQAGPKYDNGYFLTRAGLDFLDNR